MMMTMIIFALCVCIVGLLYLKRFYVY